MAMGECGVLLCQLITQYAGDYGEAGEAINANSSKLMMFSPFSLDVLLL